MTGIRKSYGIYAYDGTPVTIIAYDITAQCNVEAHKFASVEIAKEALDTVDPQLITSCGGVIIREVIEA